MESTRSDFCSIKCTHRLQRPFLHLLQRTHRGLCVFAAWVTQQPSTDKENAAPGTALCLPARAAVSNRHSPPHFRAKPRLLPELHWPMAGKINWDYQFGTAASVLNNQNSCCFAACANSNRQTCACCFLRSAAHITPPATVHRRDGISAGFEKNPCSGISFSIFRHGSGSAGFMMRCHNVDFRLQSLSHQIQQQQSPAQY